MSVVLFVLGAWVLVSVPMGLLLGWACGLNQLSSDGGAVPIAHSAERSMLTDDLCLRRRSASGCRFGASCAARSEASHRRPLSRALP